MTLESVQRNPFRSLFYSICRFGPGSRSQLFKKPLNASQNFNAGLQHMNGHPPSSPDQPHSQR